MTISEAEELYNLEIVERDRLCENSVKKTTIIGSIIGALMFVVGMILLIVGMTKPPIIDEDGFVFRDNYIEFIFGSMCCILSIAILAMFIGVVPKCNTKKNRRYPQETKNLYMNYIRCVDMPESEKEFYKQKLEDIRNAELAKSMSSISTAIIFSNLHK